MDRPDSGHAVIVRRQIMKLSSDWVSFRKNWIAYIAGMTSCRSNTPLMRMTARVYKERGPPTEAALLMLVLKSRDSAVLLPKLYVVPIH
jgi:hypothetical protein